MYVPNLTPTRWRLAEVYAAPTVAKWVWAVVPTNSDRVICHVGPVSGWTDQHTQDAQHVLSAPRLLDLITSIAAEIAGLQMVAAGLRAAVLDQVLANLVQRLRHAARLTTHGRDPVPPGFEDGRTSLA